MTFQRDRYWQDNIKDKGRLDARADKDFLWENLARLRETRPAGSVLVCSSICIGSYSGDQGESKRWGRVWPTFLLRGEKSFLLRFDSLNFDCRCMLSMSQPSCAAAILLRSTSSLIQNTFLCGKIAFRCSSWSLSLSRWMRTLANSFSPIGLLKRR